LGNRQASSDYRRTQAIKKQGKQERQGAIARPN
jgi:hypothetical protein